MLYIFLSVMNKLLSFLFANLLRYANEIITAIDIDYIIIPRRRRVSRIYKIALKLNASESMCN